MSTLTAMPLMAQQQNQLDELPMHWVKTQDQLFDVLDEIDECDILALDTEFIKRDTFFPRLALVQVNTGQNIYLIDTPRLDMAEFWEVIADVPTLVLHACGEDLGIYYLLSELPALTNVFDTQIGVGYLTGELQIGYQKALAEVIGVAVDKGESQSDWLQRPLTFEQEKYAADDVRYLLALYDVLKAQLQAQHLWQFAVEDCQSYTQELYNSNAQADQDVYLSMADFRYSRQQLAMLQALCEWREQLARATNQPRTFILRPQALKEIVEKPPQSLKQLAFTSIKPNIIRLYGEEILAIIADIRKIDPLSYPASVPMPYRSLSANIQTQLEQAITAQSQALNLPETVLMRKRWLSELYSYSLQHSIKNKSPDEGVSQKSTQNADSFALSKWLTGWRHDWIMQQILPILKTVEIAELSEIETVTDDLVENFSKEVPKTQA